MLKALTGLVLAGVASLAMASPAYAAPDCQDGTADAYGSHGSFAATNVYLSDYCAGDYTLVSVGNWSSAYVTNFGYGAFIDGIYYSPETLSFTVTDGEDYTTFYVTINPHFS